MSQKWRAKVYALDDTSNWVDKGAGYASVQVRQRNRLGGQPKKRRPILLAVFLPPFQNVNNGCVIEVWNDESTETLLVIDVVPGDNFRHEQGALEREYESTFFTASAASFLTQ